MSDTTKGCPIHVQIAKYGCIKGQIEKFRSNGGINPTEGYITWFVDAEKTSDSLSYQDSVDGMTKAITYIQPHMGKVEFKQVIKKEDAQIVIGFYKNDDRDLPEQFENSTLAYAYLGDGSSAFNIIGDMYFNDENFNWSLGATRTTIDYIRVVLHECLHSLSLHHQTIDETGILFPSYNPNVPIKLTQDTINGLNSIYGRLDGPEDKIPDQNDSSDTKQCLIRILKELFTSKTRLGKLTEKQLVLIANEIGISSTEKDLKRNTLDKIWEELKN